MTIEIPAAPNDFEAYWAQTMEELAALPPAAELTWSALRSTEFSDLYELRLTSVGPYRIFAYFCVPKGDGPFPVWYHTPNYGSVVHIPSYEDRQQYVSVSLRARGQRLADQPFAAAYPGLLTTGIDSPESYVYQGIVADCCRVIDFLVSRPEVDQNRIAVIGDELALFTAALREQVSSLYYSPALFYGASQLAPRTNGYPLEELNEYIRTYPEKRTAVEQTLAYFEPTHVASMVRADTMVMTGSERDFYAADTLRPLLDAFSEPPALYESQHSGYKDGVHQAQWLAHRAGFDAPVLPPHWQS
jgi:cephalosporin-C deacetylase